MRAVFVTHAGPGIGGGHLSRCTALSQALSAMKCDCSWVLNRDSRELAADLRLKKTAFVDNPFTDEILPFLKEHTFAVVDSYVPGASFYDLVRDSLPVVLIDDLAERGVDVFSSVVVNYGISARRDMYREGPELYLLGPRYALLRSVYWNITPRDGDYALFVAGAADVVGASVAVAGLWREEMPQLEIVLGPLVAGCIADTVLRISGARKNIGVRVAPTNFPELLAGAGRVICSASVTAYEALAMEKRLAVFAVAENQRGLGAVLASMNVAVDLGEWSDVTSGLLEDVLDFCPSMEALRGLVNKRGAFACASELLRFFGSKERAE